MTQAEVRAQLRQMAEPARAALHQRFFKTGPGEYGEGDVFIGVTMPKIRALARLARDLPLADVSNLLRSQIHEERMLALIILVLRSHRADDKTRRELCHFYLKHLDWINNWDLVDASAPRIVGPWFIEHDKAPLYKLARSKDLWRRRVAVLSTFWFIHLGEFEHSLRLCKLLLNDKHDLMHKACGWMLREIGKRDVKVLEAFLNRHGKHMPRTMLRYAIERFPENKRRRYLTRT